MNQNEFLAAALRNPVNAAIADELFRLALPDAWIVSGCLVQTVWNVLTGRAVDYGISDYDVFYFDPDTSWRGRRRRDPRPAGRAREASTSPIEARNQARVHLWYPRKARPALPAAVMRRPRASIAFSPKIPASESAARTDGYDVYAPHGFDDIAQT